MITSILFIFQDARDLPPRDYLGLTDPYFVISLIRSRRSLRNHRQTLIADYKSLVMKKTSNPVYNQDFPFDLNKEEINVSKPRKIYIRLLLSNSF